MAKERMVKVLARLPPDAHRRLMEAGAREPGVCAADIIRSGTEYVTERVLRGHGLPRSPRRSRGER